jgi:hypothetical protein
MPSFFCHLDKNQFWAFYLETLAMKQESLILFLYGYIVMIIPMTVNHLQSKCRTKNSSLVSMVRTLAQIVLPAGL